MTVWIVDGDLGFFWWLGAATLRYLGVKAESSLIVNFDSPSGHVTRYVIGPSKLLFRVVQIQYESLPRCIYPALAAVLSSV